MSAPPLAAALAEARRLAPGLSSDWVPLAGLTGRTLAADVAPRIDHPPRDAAAMDGWAVRSEDGAGPRRVLGESAAGAPWHGRIGRGEAVRISTGALLPRGADAVVRLEDAHEEGRRLAGAPAPAPGRDVRGAGEDLSVGRVVLRAGARIAPHEVGVVAACGHDGAWCRRRPRVRILTTGTELVEPGGPPDPERIYDSNSHALRAQAEDAGADVLDVRRVADERAAVEGVLREALADERVDLLVVGGGLSVGRHDHVRPALAASGVEIVAGSVSMRPGRPTLIGKLGAARVLGLPGNPAAAALGFHVLGRALMGVEAPWTRLPLAGTLRSRRDVDELVRCAERDGEAVPLRRQGSGALTSLAGASCVAWLPWGRTRFAAGDRVVVSRLG